MIDIFQENETLALLPTDERTKALQRTIPRTQVEEVLAQTGHDKAFCRRLPGWFMVWFVIGLGLFCKDSYRQIFRWFQVFRLGGVPGVTGCIKVRKSGGV